MDAVEILDTVALSSNNPNEWLDWRRCKEGRRKEELAALLVGDVQTIGHAPLQASSTADQLPSLPILPIFACMPSLMLIISLAQALIY